jgi:hypothetical protein
MRFGLFLLFGLVINISSAQIYFGMKGGLNLSDVVINNSNDPDVEPAYQIKPGMHAGFFLSARGEKKIGLAAEILYSDKGTKAINTIHLHYVSIPLLVRYQFGDNFFGEAGPEISYLINANSKHGNLNSTWDNKVDLGLDVGAQYVLGKVNLGVRFNAGFSSVIRSTGTSPSGERISYQNRAVQFFVAVPIREIIN